MFEPVNSRPDFIGLEYEMMKFWDEESIVEKYLNKNNDADKKYSFIDGPITANNPMGVHHAWGRTYKDLYQRYKTMQGYEQRYQNGFDGQGLWIEVEVEKELGFKSKKDIEKFGIDKFVELCKQRVDKFSAIQTKQSIRLGYWMDWDNSYYTMSDENNYTIWHFLKKLWGEGKVYRGSDVVPWSGRSGTSYSQMEIIEGRKLVAHKSVFVRFPIKNKKDEYLLVWTTTPWTLSSNVVVGVNIDLKYVKIRSNDGSIYYFANDNLKFERLEKQFKEKKQWIEKYGLHKAILLWNQKMGRATKMSVYNYVQQRQPDSYTMVGFPDSKLTAWPAMMFDYMNLRMIDDWHKGFLNSGDLVAIGISRPTRTYKLDELGNSSRGIQFFKELTKIYPFHIYDNILSKQDNIVSKNDIVNNHYNIYSLLVAASSGDLNSIIILESKMVDLNSFDYDKRTALHLACSEGHINVIEYLLKKKVDKNCEDRWGNKPLDDIKIYKKKLESEEIQILEDNGEKIYEKMLLECNKIIKCLEKD